jgi:hypothetical protein
MARKQYRVDLKIVYKDDAPNGFYYHPDIPADVTDFEMRHFNLNSMKCKIEVEETANIPSKVNLTPQAWGDFEDIPH